MYSDTDTVCLRPIEEWGVSADLWDDGKGWLAAAHDEETLDGRKKAVGPPSVVVGIEVDVGNRGDWYLVRLLSSLHSPLYPTWL